MRVHRFLLAGCILTGLAGALCAQGIADGLAAARQCIEARQWQVALASLLDLREQVATDQEREKLASSLMDVGYALQDATKLELALSAHEAALTLQRDIHENRDHRDVATSLASVASCLESLGRGNAALPMLEASLDMRRRLHGAEDHADVALGLSQLAYCLQRMGRFDAALARFEESLALYRRVHGGADHRNVTVSIHNVAFCLDKLDQCERALPRYEEALATWQRHRGAADDPYLAAMISNEALCRMRLGQWDQAVSRLETALAMFRRIYGADDHPYVASALNNLAHSRKELGQSERAAIEYEEALAISQRLHQGRDHRDLASILNSMGSCLQSLGRWQEALPRFEAALAMRRRLAGDGDHEDIAEGLNNVATCHASAGRSEQARDGFAAALAMRRRLHGEADAESVASSLHNLGVALHAMGRWEEALSNFESALAMYQRLAGPVDDVHVASSLNVLATCLESLGRPDQALHRLEMAAAMYGRIYAGRDHPDLATSVNNLAHCLDRVGLTAAAVAEYERALAMQRRIHGGGDHPHVAASLGNVANCLVSAGRFEPARRMHEESLAMARRLCGGRDHPDVAAGMDDLADCLAQSGRVDEALELAQAALDMQVRLHGDGDHPDPAFTRSNVARYLYKSGKVDLALAEFERALAMTDRLYRGRDHANTVSALTNIARCQRRLGSPAQAIAHMERAVAMIERLRAESRGSLSATQSLFDELKRGGAFEQMQAAAHELGRPAVAFEAAERSRSRSLLDSLALSGVDPIEEAMRRARDRGDDTLCNRLSSLRRDCDAAVFACDRVLRELTGLDAAAVDAPSRREELLRSADVAAANRRRLSDERARLVGDVLPVGRACGADEVRSQLQAGEFLLEFTVSADASLLYVLTADGGLRVLPLPGADGAVARLVPIVAAGASRAALAARRGRDPEPSVGDAEVRQRSRELFQSLIPADLWPQLRAAKRVFIAPHRALHRLPFELLVVDVERERPVYWLDAGPAIAYVPSGSVLVWIRQRLPVVRDLQRPLELVAIGDPSLAASALEPPEHGVLVSTVNPGGEGARAGLRPLDVLLKYDGKPLVDDKSLRALRGEVEAAITAGKRETSPIVIDLWRQGTPLRVEVNAGLLGIQVGSGRARAAFEASLAALEQIERRVHRSDLERLGALPPLRGARREAEEIVGSVIAKGGAAQKLLGKEATESAVFDVAGRTRCLHFACHGIAEEYAGQSLSMLVLARQGSVNAADDGLLKLDDLLHRWRGRLDGCRLVVLSACRTNIGEQFRDDAPQALPVGFLVAGASSVVSSLWAVDDTSTRELMVDLYARLSAKDGDRLDSFVAAKKALRAKYPDPYHWAPFLYMGSPE